MQNNRTLIIVSLCAALIGCIADVLLLYASEGNYHLPGFHFFDSISVTRIKWGFFLGIFVIPFEILGLNLLGKALYDKQDTKQGIYQFLLCYLFILGVMYHAVISFIGIIKKTAQNSSEVLSICQNMHDGLVLVMGIGFVLLTLSIVLPLIKGKGVLPKWILFFNPILIYAFILLCYFTIPSIGNYFMVAGFNFSIFIFLLAGYFAMGTKNFLTTA